MVDKETDKHHGKKPHVYRGTRTVNQCVVCILDSLETYFSRVLLLVVRLTLSTRDTKGTENVQDSFADLNLSAVTGKFRHGSPFFDLILQCVC